MRRLWRYFRDARLDKELIRRQADTIIVQQETLERYFDANRSMEGQINDLTELAKNSGENIIRIADDALKALNSAYEIDSTFMRSRSSLSVESMSSSISGSTTAGGIMETAMRPLTLQEVSLFVSHLPDPETASARKMTVILDTNKGFRSIELERRTIRNGRVAQEVWMYGGVVVSPLWVDTPYTFTPPNPQKIVERTPVGTLVVEIPPPPRELQPNIALRSDHRQLTGPRNQAKHDASLALRNAAGAPVGFLMWKAVRAHAMFLLHNDVQRDDDNLLGWLKSTRDQMAADLGITDDLNGWEWVRPSVAVIERKKQERVMITLWGMQ